MEGADGVCVLSIGARRATAGSAKSAARAPPSAAVDVSFWDANGCFAPRTRDGTWLVSPGTHVLVGGALVAAEALGGAGAAAAASIVDAGTGTSFEAIRSPSDANGAGGTYTWVLPVTRLAPAAARPNVLHLVVVLRTALGAAPVALAKVRALVYKPDALLVQLEALFGKEPPRWWVQPVQPDAPAARPHAQQLALQMTSLELVPGKVAFRVMVSHGLAAQLAGCPVVLAIDVFFDGVLVSQATAWACDSLVDTVLDPALIVGMYDAGTVAVRLSVGVAASVVRTGKEDRPGQVKMGGVVGERLYVYTVM